MAKVARLKQPAKVHAFVPQSKDDCAEMINQIGRIQREIQTEQAAMNDEIAAITDRYTGKITQWQAELKALQDGVQSWCEAHRAELTEGGKSKSGHFVTGDVQWRQRPPSVAIRGVEAVLEALRRYGLERFIRAKEEINKEAILNEPAAVANVPGISIKTGVEDFVITPFEQELA